MGVLTKCPSCGMDSDQVRCPRCNALKVVGCTGACTLCGERKKHGCSIEVPLEGDRPSDLAHEDDEHPGTPLDR